MGAPRGTHVQLSPLRHGVQRVDYQIQKHLFDLPARYSQIGNVIREFRDNFHLVVLTLLRGQFQYLLHQTIYIGSLFFLIQIQSGKTAHAIRGVCDAKRLSVGYFQIFSYIFGIIGIFLREFQKTEQGVKRIIDLVNDRGSQLSDSRHLLRVD